MRLLNLFGYASFKLDGNASAGSYLFSACISKLQNQGLMDLESVIFTICLSFVEMNRCSVFCVILSFEALIQF